MTPARVTPARATPQRLPAGSTSPNGETSPSTVPGPCELDLPEGRTLSLGGPGRIPAVMGILNLTPDSFSDGGRWSDPEAAVAHGLEMIERGADLLDLGAESTRPAGRTYGAGAETVTADEELRRLLPVLERLRSATSTPISVDTRKAAVARAALAAGADLINDVTGLSDPELGVAVAEVGVPIVLMHLRGTLPDLAEHAHYEDVVAEVTTELEAALERADAVGIARQRILLDPGLGFAKNDEHNLRLLRNLSALRRLGCPLLVGASRKRFVGRLSGAPPEERLPGSLAAVAWAAHHSAAIVRVHDVDETRRFLDVWQAIAAAGATE